MTKAQKHRFVFDLLENVGERIVKAIDNMPDEWNGIELRQYVADKFSQQCAPRHIISRKRRHAYQNDVITRNL